jgi:type IV secretion system protein VirB7
MTLQTFAALLLVSAITSGCASIRYPLPSCDGGARRALNAGLWSYEKRSDLNDTASRLACG